MAADQAGAASSSSINSVGRTRAVRVVFQPVRHVAELVEVVAEAQRVLSSARAVGPSPAVGASSVSVAGTVRTRSRVDLCHIGFVGRARG